MRLRLVILALGLAILAVGCGGGDEPAADQPAPVATTPADTAASPPVDSATDGSSGAVTSDATIAEAATTASIDSSADTPDAATYQQRFDASTEVIYVVYHLQPGAGGDVQTTWTHNGTTVNESTRTLPSDGGWAYEGYPAPSGGFDPGQYEIALTVVGGTGSPTILQFEVQ
jgi:hypothetical protein